MLTKLIISKYLIIIYVSIHLLVVLTAQNTKYIILWSNKDGSAGISIMQKVISYAQIINKCTLSSLATSTRNAIIIDFLLVNSNHEMVDLFQQLSVR